MSLRVCVCVDSALRFDAQAVAKRAEDQLQDPLFSSIVAEDVGFGEAYQLELDQCQSVRRMQPLLADDPAVLKCANHGEIAPVIRDEVAAMAAVLLRLAKKGTSLKAKSQQWPKLEATAKTDDINAELANVTAACREIKEYTDHIASFKTTLQKSGSEPSLASVTASIGLCTTLCNNAGADVGERAAHLFRTVELKCADSCSKMDELNFVSLVDMKETAPAQLMDLANSQPARSVWALWKLWGQCSTFATSSLPASGAEH